MNSRDRSRRSRRSYAAFISYKRGKGTELARAVKSALHTFARPWYRVRAMRVFLDQANLPAGADLSSRICEALADSEVLLFVASPDAVNSDWVKKELSFWLDPKQAYGGSGMTPDSRPGRSRHLSPRAPLASA